MSLLQHIDTTQLISAILGGIISFIIWIITNTCSWFIPQIGISNSIAKRNGTQHEIKIINLSRLKGIHDITVYAMYHFASDNDYERQIVHIGYLKKLPKKIFYSNSKYAPFEFIIKLPPPALIDKMDIHNKQSLYSKPSSNDNTHKGNIPPKKGKAELGTKANAKTSYTLNDFFNGLNGSGKAYIDIVIVCYDTIFGTSRTVKTMRYFKDAIMQDTYFEKGSITAKPIPNNNGKLIYHSNDDNN